MHGKAIGKSAIGEIVKASRGNITRGEGGFTAPHMKPQLQGANMLTHIELWPTFIKPNPS